MSTYPNQRLYASIKEMTRDYARRDALVAKSRRQDRRDELIDRAVDLTLSTLPVVFITLLLASFVVVIWSVAR